MFRKERRGVEIFTSVIFLISVAFFVGAVHHLLALKKPGMYPPKALLRKRAGTLAGGGAIFLLIGIIFYTFQ
ncbi:hypothetical protein [Bacillus sp. ISL-55]|uniref:hypothetical protein n=1 Tax=Bacillus sp. ISL-55 TaxID=2819134 RepID=UPI001BE9A806|nr:hypothetical protein [Bacillus sp. ISL-55]